MKNINLTLLFCFIGLFSLSAQYEENSVIKATYESNNASEFLINTIKKQVQNESELNTILYLMYDSKVHYSLFCNVDNAESIYVLDSVAILEGVSTTGYMNLVTSSKDEMYCEELFMDGEISYTGNVSDLEWEITEETKELFGYNCTKAILNNTPGYHAWFTTDIPVDEGPGIYKGLPGLVLSVNTPFELINVKSVEKVSRKDFETIRNENTTEDQKEGSSISEMFVKKDNFKRMMSGS